MIKFFKHAKIRNQNAFSLFLYTSKSNFFFFYSVGSFVLTKIESITLITVKHTIFQI